MVHPTNPIRRALTLTRILPVALVQAEQLVDDFDAYAREVAELGSRMPPRPLIVHPEVHLFGRHGDLSVEALRDIAQPLDGPMVRDLAQLAGDLKAWLIPGSIVEPAPDGGVYNTTVVLSPDGELVASYRKIFPWRPSEPYTPGTAFTVFDIPGTGRFGIAICYDIWFPEVCRQLAWMGAEVIINPVRTTTPDRAQELVLVQANAITNQVFMLSVNAAAPVAQGQSLVVDPDGVVLAHAAHDRPEVMMPDIDLDRVTAIRREGTAGINRMWSQFRPGDRRIPLSVYDGRIDPDTWNPETAQQKEPA